MYKAKYPKVVLRDRDTVDSAEIELCYPTGFNPNERRYALFVGKGASLMQDPQDLLVSGEEQKSAPSSRLTQRRSGVNYGQTSLSEILNTKLNDNKELSPTEQALHDIIGEKEKEGDSVSATSSEPSCEEPDSSDESLEPVLSTETSPRPKYRL